MSDQLKKIPTSRLSRGFKLLKLTASVGASSITSRVAEALTFKEENKKSKKLFTQLRQAENIVATLSQMKGAAMKLGQIISIHGDHLFPKEVIDVLSKLQASSDSIEYSKIEKILKSELKSKFGSELVELSSEPIAAASIGQVHRGVFKKNNQTVAVKIQYPGIEQSIDSDIDSLASLFSILTSIPSVQSFNDVTDEIKTVLKLETDYLREGKNIDFFRDYFKDDSYISIPEYFRDISTKNILSTGFLQGKSVQEFSASNATQELRNRVGMKYLEVFYHELFKLGKVQTDPNFANYKIEVMPYGFDPDFKLILFDFGAVKEFPIDFCANYRTLVRACLNDDYDGIHEMAVKMGFLHESDTKDLVDIHYKFIKMFMEPFDTRDPYNWSTSDLAGRIRRFSPKFIFAFNLRPPPRDFIFLNRKIIGTYFFLSQLKCNFNPRELLERFLN